MKEEKWYKSPKFYIRITIFFFALCVIMVVFYFCFTGSSVFSEKSIEWANFGQYFGSITGLLAFAGVLYSAALSEERAKEAKEEAKKSELRAINAEEEMIKREERDYFFKMLDLHHLKGRELSSSVDKKLTFSSISMSAKYDVMFYCLLDRFFKKDFKIQSFDSSEVDKAEHFYRLVLNKSGYVDNTSSNINDNKNLMSFYETLILRKEKFFIEGTDRWYVETYFKLIMDDISLDTKLTAIAYASSLIIKYYKDLIEPYFNNFNSMIETITKFKEHINYMDFLRNQLSGSEQSLLFYYYLGENRFVEKIQLLNIYRMLINISPEHFPFYKIGSKISEDVSFFLNKSIQDIIESSNS